MFKLCHKNGLASDWVIGFLFDIQYKCALFYLIKCETVLQNKWFIIK